MKRLQLTLIFAFFTLTPLFAIAGFGGYYLQDGYDIAEDDASTTGFGGYVYVDVMPFIDVEAGFDVLGKTSFAYDVNGNNGKISLPQKAGWYIGVQRKIIKLPMVKFYYGAGISQNKIVPELTEEYILGFDLENEQYSSASVLKAVENDMKYKTGFFLELGARAKPWIIPISVNAKLRYNFLKDVVLNKNSYLSVMIGAGYAL